jgi:hypothetical protein
MASRFNLASLAATAMAQTMLNLLDRAILEIYSGAQPMDADMPIAGNQLLASFVIPSAAGFNIQGWIITFGMIPDTTWKMNGKATFARFSRDGRAIFDCSVGVKDADMIINANPVVEGAVAHIVGGATYTVSR